MKTTQKESKPRPLTRALLSAAVLLAGAAGMIALSGMKEPPAEVRQEERALRVETTTAKPLDQRVTIRGFGEVRALNTVSLSPEVAGAVTAVHPRLDVGEIIPAGERLFQVDDRNYVAALESAKAKVAQSESILKRLAKELETRKTRLATLRRNRELAENEFERVRRLYDRNQVGTRSSVEKAEQAYNAARDAVDQLAESVATYPLRIQETEAALMSAEAARAMAAADLERCEIRAPFSGRVTSADVETGQYVTPGKPLVTLADDAVLEIHASIDSRDAQKWLRFERTDAASGSWFEDMVPVPVAVQWTESPEGTGWNGTLHRAVRFAPETRTLTVAVRVQAEDAASEAGLPLVEGMFCSVEIPGKPLQGVFRLPRWVVGFQDTVYLAENGRLKTVTVTVARVEGDYAYVTAGIEDGDRVITTRLSDPLENTLLQIVRPETKQTSS